MYKVKIFAESTDHWMEEMEDRINTFIKDNGIVDFDIKITCSDYMVIAVLKYCQNVTMKENIDATNTRHPCRANRVMM